MSLTKEVVIYCFMGVRVDSDKNPLMGREIGFQLSSGDLFRDFHNG